MSATHTTIESPLGESTLVAVDGVLSGLYFPGHWYPPARNTLGARSGHGFEPAEAQLAQYFAGERIAFDLPTRLAGDEFQRRVWEPDRCHIPTAQTTTYGELAAELGDPILAQPGRRRGRPQPALASSSPATAWSARTASSPAMRAGSSASGSCSSSRRRPPRPRPSPGSSDPPRRCGSGPS